MKDELSNSVVEQTDKPETQEAVETTTSEVVNNVTQEENVQNIEVIHSSVEIPKKPSILKVIFIILFIGFVLGGSVYYFGFLNNKKTDSNVSERNLSSSSKKTEEKLSSTSKSTSTNDITSGTRRADYELLNYLSRAPKYLDPFEGKNILGEKYYKINLDEYKKCQSNSDVSFDFKGHKISYKCIPFDMYDENDIYYQAEGKVDNVNIKTRNTMVSCGTYEIYGSDDEVVIFETGNCDTTYGLVIKISFYSKDGNLKKDVKALYFYFQYQGLKYIVTPYMIGNYLYYVNSDNFSDIDDAEFDCKLYKLDLNNYEDTVIYNFKGKVN